MPAFVKTFSSVSAAAPVLDGTPQSLQKLLRACLVTGYGSKAVASLTVAAGVATATYATAHAYAVDDPIRFAGASTAAINSTWTVLTAGSNSITFKVAGVADGTIGGVITSDVAPAGWLEVHQAGAVSAFKPAAVEASGFLLRVDDADVYNARVRAYESMDSVNVGSGQMPLDTQIAGGGYWLKSSQANNSARSWFLVADDRAFYLAVDQDNQNRYILYFFGDFEGVRSGSPWNVLLTVNGSDMRGVGSVPPGCCGYSSRTDLGGAFFARSYTGAAGAVSAMRVGSHHNGTAAAVYAAVDGYSFGSHPNRPNNGLLTGELELWEQGGLRGVLPGLLHPIQSAVSSLSTGVRLDGLGDFAGRRLLPIRVGVAASGSSLPSGVALIDTTGPWRRS